MYMFACITYIMVSLRMSDRNGTQLALRLETEQSLSISDLASRLARRLFRAGRLRLIHTLQGLCLLCFLLLLLVHDNLLLGIDRCRVDDARKLPLTVWVLDEFDFGIALVFVLVEAARPCNSEVL